MKLRPSLWIVPIVAAIGVAVTLAFILIGALSDGDDLTAAPTGGDLLELLAVIAIVAGVFALIALVCIAIPFARIDERGFWQFTQGQGMYLVRPLGHGERIVVSERQCFVLCADGEYERLRIRRWTLSKRTWAVLEARYPLEQRQDAD
ncbi:MULTISPECIES: hypothetical protein [Glycomyces]|uniref:Uncharacterized protein n=2 Tax=Glycomyces TaxID=58113 RepID=A0A9X3SU48_9ACTN|nr:hypothetical protein [Glycomyces lechevalierae]MDA1385170.1 hypothetical protein [Glycomyces lechevalierae]MDR7337214.1 hypothetical protein [Glycomyces lechevalierae]